MDSTKETQEMYFFTFALKFLNFVSLIIIIIKLLYFIKCKKKPNNIILALATEKPISVDP